MLSEYDEHGIEGIIGEGSGGSSSVIDSGSGGGVVVVVDGGGASGECDEDIEAGVEVEEGRSSASGVGGACDEGDADADGEQQRRDSSTEPSIGLTPDDESPSLGSLQQAAVYLFGILLFLDQTFYLFFFFFLSYDK